MNDEQLSEFIDLYVKTKRMKMKYINEVRKLKKYDIDIEEFEDVLKYELTPNEYYILAQYTSGNSLKRIASDMDKTHSYMRKQYSDIIHKIKLIAKIVIKYDL